MPGSNPTRSMSRRSEPRARRPGRHDSSRTGRSMTTENTVEIPAGEVPTRDQIALEDTWDLSGIYSEERDWEADADRMSALVTAVVDHRGTLGESTARLRRALDDIMTLRQTLER